MRDAPERIWAVHWNTEGAVMNGAWADTIRHFGGGVEYVRADVFCAAVMALDCLAALGQAEDAYQAQLAAEKKLAQAVEALDWIGNYMVMSMALDQGDLCMMMKQHARATLAELKGEKP